MNYISISDFEMCGNDFADTNEQRSTNPMTDCSAANDAAVIFRDWLRAASTLSRDFRPMLPFSLSLSLSLFRRVSRGARMCYRESWQHYGPAFAAWPAIVFLVSLQSAARSILPRSSTTTSASFAASYFTGAQHGVARYLGNFAERGCSLCQQPVPRRQRIRRSLRRSCSRSLFFSRFPFLHSPSLSPFSSFFFPLPLSLVALRFLQHGSRVRANVHPRISVFTAALPVLVRLSLLFLRTPIRFVLVVPLALCFIPLSVIAFVGRNRSSCTHGSTSHRAHEI